MPTQVSTHPQKTTALKQSCHSIGNFKQDELYSFNHIPSNWCSGQHLQAKLPFPAVTSACSSSYRDPQMRAPYLQAI